MDMDSIWNAKDLAAAMSGTTVSSSSVSVLSSRSCKCRLNMPVRQSEFSSNAICCCCYMLATSVLHTVARGCTRNLYADQYQHDIYA